MPPITFRLTRDDYLQWSRAMAREQSDFTAAIRWVGYAAVAVGFLLGIERICGGNGCAPGALIAVGLLNCVYPVWTSYARLEQRGVTNTPSVLQSLS